MFFCVLLGFVVDGYEGFDEWLVNGCEGVRKYLACCIERRMGGSVMLHIRSVHIV